MKNNGKRLYEYITHILAAIERIQRYTEDMDESGFLANELVQDGVIRNLEIIGEASRNIHTSSPEFVDAHPEIPFAFAYEMRNALSHGYFKVDLQIVWKTIEHDLPNLVVTLDKIRRPAGAGNR